MDLISENKLLVTMKEGFYFYQIYAKKTISMSSFIKFGEFTHALTDLIKSNPISSAVYFALCATLLLLAFTKLQALFLTTIIASGLWVISSSIHGSVEGGPFLMKKTIDLSIRDNRILEASISGTDFLEDHVEDKYIQSVISMASMSLSKFFVIYRALFLYILKGDLRKEISPFIRDIFYSGNRVKISHDSGTEIELQQVVINKGKDVIALVEIDC